MFARSIGAISGAAGSEKVFEKLIEFAEVFFHPPEHQRPQQRRDSSYSVGAGPFLHTAFQEGPVLRYQSPTLSATHPKFRALIVFLKHFLAASFHYAGSCSGKLLRANSPARPNPSPFTEAPSFSLVLLVQDPELETEISLHFHLFRLSLPHLVSAGQ